MFSTFDSQTLLVTRVNIFLLRLNPPTLFFVFEKVRTSVNFEITCLIFIQSDSLILFATLAMQPV